MEYPAFVEDQQYLTLDTNKSENDQLKAMLANLTRVHLLSANKFDSFDELIREYLASGVEIFGLETGIVSHIADGIYTICDIFSPLDVLKQGQEFALEDTYCKTVYHSKQVIGMPHVGGLTYMRKHPVYLNLKLEAYLSAPIFVDSKLFGTLNFTSTQKRLYGFSEHEKNLITLLANSIGAYLHLRNKEEHLKTLNEQMKKFVGYVAHDLRSPIGSVLTLSTLARRAQNDPERQNRILKKIYSASESALELVTSILEAAALGSGKIELNKASIELDSVIQSAIDSISELAQEAKHEIAIGISPNASATLDKDRIIQVLNNLLVNAIKFSPSESRIQIMAKEEVSGTTFCIRNKIATSKEALKDIKHFNSVGFGLEIVRDILRAHETELKISNDADYYECRFTIKN